MSYREGGYAGTPLKIGAVLCAAFMAWFGWPLIKSQAGLVSLRSDVNAEQTLINDPQAGPAFEAFQTHFPDDFAQMIKSVTDGAAAHDAQAIRTGLQQAVGATLARNIGHLAQAPHEQLDTLLRSNLAVLERLETTAPRLCAEFGSTGQWGGEALTPETAAMMTALLVARIEATAAGRDRPVGSRGVVTEADARQLGAEMRRRGVAPSSIELIAGERDRADATDRMLCAAPIDMLRAIAGLSPDAADRILVGMFAIVPNGSPAGAR